MNWPRVPFKRSKNGSQINFLKNSKPTKTNRKGEQVIAIQFWKKRLERQVVKE